MSQYAGEMEMQQLLQPPPMRRPAGDAAVAGEETI